MSSEIYTEIKWCFFDDKIIYSQHSLYEMLNEEYGIISDDEVAQAVSNGVIIESYSDDKPYPSYLIYGSTLENRPLHIVAAYNHEDNIVIIITVYQPDPELWVDYKIRRK